TLRIPYNALPADPLLDVYGGKAWEPWAPQLAAERFLAELESLTQANGAGSPNRRESDAKMRQKGAR
ncbi:MAG: hypothetical protein ACREDV_00550, partial [Methylocella sp.]